MKGMRGVESATYSPQPDTARADALIRPVDATPQDEWSGSPAYEDFCAWLARELHDGVTQEVWYLQAELSSLAARLPEDQRELRADVERLTKVAQDAYQELRATLNSINSRRAPRVDLTAELVELTLKFSEALGMEVEFRSGDGEQKVEVPGKVGREIRRLVQEALWNSWRHSMSNRACVKTQLTKIGLVVTVSDDGCGFSPDKVDESHYGLRNMRERAEALKGRLYVTSGSGKGTLVSLHVPPEILDPPGHEGEDCR